MNQIRLDWNQLSLYSEGDINFEAEILALFVQYTETQISGLYNAWAMQDFQTVAALSHQIKGACGNIGARALHQLLCDLEQCAQRQDQSTLEHLLEMCAAAFQDVVTEVQQRTNCSCIESWPIPSH
jgi:HPt (histidine-containing phosphotransfer) domain-containing protein